MPKQMTPKQLVMAYKHEMFETAKARVLREDFGVRIRRDADARDHGDNVWEVATTYFYRHQNSTRRQFDELTKFAQAHGFEITPLDWWSGKPLEGEIDRGALAFEDTPWPKESWAKILVRIELAESK